MNWTKISSIAEILSSIAILVTLIFLTIQVRQNTVAVHASSLDVTLDADLQHLYHIVDEPELWSSLHKEELSETEKIRLFHFLAAMTRIRERDWLQFESGALDPEVWTTYQSGLLGTLSAIQARKWWNGVTGRDGGVFTPGFVDYVNGELEKLPVATPENTLGVFD